jgi:hypothetical protein
MKERAHVGHNKRPLENVSIFRYLKEFWNFVYLAPKVLTYIHYGTPAATKVRTGLIWLSPGMPKRVKEHESNSAQLRPLRHAVGKSNVGLRETSSFVSVVMGPLLLAIYAAAIVSVRR